MHTPTSKWLISASNVHTPKRKVQESQKYFGCVHLCLSLATSRSMSHKSSVSGMGGAVRAIRLINQKRLLLVMVGINIILSFGKDYVKLAWKFTGKPGRENWDFWHLKKFEMTQKTRKSCTYWSPLYPGKSVLKSKGGSIRISDIQNYLTWLKLQECKQFFLVLKHPKNMHIKFLCISEVDAGKMTCFHFKLRQAICTLVQNDCVNQR